MIIFRLLNYKLTILMSSDKYIHSEVEDNIYSYWEKNKLFKACPICKLPVTLGGGITIEYFFEFFLGLNNSFFSQYE